MIPKVGSEWIAKDGRKVRVDEIVTPVLAQDEPFANGDGSQSWIPHTQSHVIRDQQVWPGLREYVLEAYRCRAFRLCRYC